VLVCPPHYERFWNGYEYVNQYIPARYEQRLVQVWIPERHGGGTFDLNLKWKWHTW